MKKVFSRFALFTLLSIMLVLIVVPFSFAQVDNEAVAEGAKTAGVTIRGFAEGLVAPLFGEFEVGTRLMLSLLLFLVIWSIQPSVIAIDSGIIRLAVVGIITALAMVATPSNFITAILAQYGALGATILSVIPFIIIFVFSIRVQNAIVARVIWLFYFMYYFTLYIYLSLKVFEKGGTWLWVTAETIPYLGAAVVGLLIVLFISPIRNMMFKGDLSALEEAGKRMIGKTALLHDLQKKELKEAYGS
jgi:hypothetical protein